MVKPRAPHPSNLDLAVQVAIMPLSQDTMASSRRNLSPEEVSPGRPTVCQT